MTSAYGGRFAGRTALVTGGGSGIGAALTRALVTAGADVLCTDIDLAAAEKVAASATGVGSVGAAALDVTDARAVQAAVDGVVARSGRLDLLFNNAGIVYVGEIDRLTLEQWDRIIDINIRGVVHGVAAVYPHMIAARSGHIVNTASAAGILASGLVTSYVATKHAVFGLSLALRTEALNHGVGVTVVCPGAVDTPILDKGAVGSVDGRAFFLASGRSGRPYDVDRLAGDVLTAVARNRAQVVVPREIRIGWLLNRLAPGLIQRLGVRNVARHLKAGVR
jgi:NAD(P)-dependent dehydrogenase (short-subunit alcohol dehydrogenase family)